MTEQRIVITIDANGKPAVAAFDGVSVAMDKTRSASDKLNQSTDKGKQKADEAGGKWAKFGGNVGQVAGVALAGLAALIARQINAADEAGKLAQKLGISTEFISEMGYAAQQSGTNSKTLEAALFGLAENAGKAAAGGKEQSKAFRALNVDLRDSTGKMRGLEQLLPQIADRFATLSDGPEKSAMAVRLFGNAGRDLIPLLNQGSKGMDAFRKQAVELGLSVSGDVAAQSAEFKDNLDKLANIAVAFGNQILPAILPVLNTLAELLGEDAAASAKMTKESGFLTTAFQYCGVAGVAVRAVVQAIVNVFAAALDATIAFGKGFYNVMAESIKASGNFISAVAQQNWTGAYLSLVQGQQNTEKAVSDSWEKMKIAVEAGADGIGAALDEGVAAAYKILNPAIKKTEDAAASAGQAMRQYGLDLSDTGAAAADAGDPMGAYADLLQRIAEDAERYAQGNADIEEQIKNLQDELNGLTPAQIRYNRAMEETLALMEQQIALGVLDQGPPDAQQAAALERLKQRLVLLQQLRDAQGLVNASSGDVAESMGDASEAAQQAAEESNRAWSRFADDFAGAILDGTESVKSFFKRMLDDIKRQILASGIKSLLGKLFNLGGGGGSFALAGGGGGIGIGQLFGSLFGGGGSGGGLSFSQLLGGGQGGLLSGLQGLNTSIISLNSLFAGRAFELAPGFVGPPSVLAGGQPALGLGGSVLAGLGGAYYGYQRSGNAAGAIGYGALGIGTAGTLAGLAGGASLGAAAGGAFAGLGAAAAIPIIGWIAAIAALVDMVAGGKLFGTKYRPESSTSTLSIGAEGGEASMSLREVRQRSLFRGRKWRDREQDPGDEAREAAQAFWQQQADASEHYAELLGSEVAPVIDASIRTLIEYDKKGREKARKIMVDILGRSWEAGSPEEAAMRVSAEQMIASIDAALGDVFLEAIAKVQQIDRDLIDDRGGGGPGRGRDPIDPLGPDAGEASRIAERWRADAEQLMEGAQFLLAAATDMRHGFSLIGEDGPGSLTAITELVEDMARGNETLAETYARLQTNSQMMQDALELMGISVSETGADFVRYAQDFVDAAGGTQQAQALLGEYFQHFTTELERAELALSNIRASAVGEFADIGLNLDDFMGKGGLDRFNDLFMSMFDDLTAQQQVNWAEAGVALARLTEAEAALAAARADASGATEQQAAAEQAAVDAARNALDLAQLLGSLRWDDLQAGMTDAERAIAEVNRAFDAHIAQAIALAASEADLAEIEALRAGALDRLAEAEDARRRAAYQELAEERRRAAMERASSIAGVLDPLDWNDSLRGLSDYERQVATLNHQFDDYRATLIANGATVAQLAQLDTYRINQLADLEASHNADLLAGINDRYSAEMAWLKQLVDYRDSLLLNEQLTTLTPAEQLAEAKRQFDAVATAALGGDAEARSNVQSAANPYLQELREYYGSDARYTQGFDAVMELINTLIADSATNLTETGTTDPAVTPPGTSTGGSTSVSIDAAPIVQPMVALQTINRDGFAGIRDDLRTLIERVERLEHAENNQTAEIRRGNDLKEVRTT